MSSPSSSPSSPALSRWLADTLGPGAEAAELHPLSASGDSNLMFEVNGPGLRAVLRCPPSVKNDRSAHDVLREYRVLRALEHTDIPHPRPLAACEDDTILGAPFYVMDHVDGFSPAEPLDPDWREDPARADLGPRAAEAIAQLGQVPWQEVGLEGFGRPEGFLARQVPRWRRQLEGYRTRELPGLDEVARWLEEHRPSDTEEGRGILHGDFHLRNVMFAPRSPARVVAVVDWEMATIGDPQLDLGTLLGTWSEPGELQLINGGATHLPGMARRADIAAAYEQAIGRPLPHVRYYMALALFKLTCILEGSYSRLQAGQSEHAGHRTYESLVPELARRALAVTRGTWGPD